MFPCYTLITEPWLITRNVLLRCIGLLFPPDLSVRHEWSLSGLYQISCGRDVEPCSLTSASGPELDLISRPYAYSTV